MKGRSLGASLVVLCACMPALAQPPRPPQSAGQDAPGKPQGALIQSVRIEGASIYPVEALTSGHQLSLGARLTRTADELAAEIRRRYHDDGFILASVRATFDEGSGALAVTIDEGRFDAVDVSGVSGEVRQRILDDLALPPGEVFNASQAGRALDHAVAFAQGAIGRAQPTFTLVSDAGRRVLHVALRARDHQSGAFLGTRGREDWYSPVDALNLGAGFHGTVFDTARFNHTYWNGYVTYKFGPDRAGYSLGLERPFFHGGRLQVGAGIHDLTASDDQWRLGDAEQSLVALTFRNTFRDYYRRKGYQVHAAVRPWNNHELLVAWRDDSHQSLQNETSYGFFRDSHGFRANALASPGDLRAVVAAYTYDSRGLDDAPAQRYRRHLLDNLFSESTARDQGVRLEWRSEIAPRSFSDDFDFTRHIATARAWWQPTSRRTISGRLVAGTSTGTLPGQRVFALGGIGTVRGYGYKESAGDRMVLLNGELRQQLGRSSFAGLLFIDSGRVFAPRAGSRAEWMHGVGAGLEIGGGSRVELGWRLDDIPNSVQVLFRLRPTF